MRDCTIISRLMEQIIYKYMQTETIQRGLVKKNSFQNF